MTPTTLQAFLRTVAVMQLLCPTQASLAETLGADPLKSQACLKAVERLEAARRDKAPMDVTEAFRTQAAQVCLGAAATGRMAAPPARLAAEQEASSLRRSQQQPAIRDVPSPISTGGLPPVPIERPSMLMNCDAAGCWDGEGRRYPRVGEDVIGPRGRCVPQEGGSYVCP